MQRPRRYSAAGRRERLTRILRRVLVALLVPIYAYGLASDEQTHGDETYWAAAGWHATSLVFVERDFSAASWSRGTGVPILTRDKDKAAAANRNPKLGMFLLGAPMLLTGVPKPRWTPYQFGRSPEWNRDQGSLPSTATLLAARLPVAALGVAAGLWMFSLFATLLHPAVAAAGALLVAVNPLVYLVCRRAMLDGPAYAFSVGAILAAIYACRDRNRDPIQSMIWLAAATCAAISCKLNAGVLIPILAIAFCVEAARAKSPQPLYRLLGAGVAALLVFVALNPTLYSAPIAGLRAMLNLGGELSRLEQLFPKDALPTLASRAAATSDILLSKYGLFSATLGHPIDAILVVAGTLALGSRASTSVTARILLIWLAVGVVAVVWWPPVRWDRYFLPALPPVLAVEFAGSALLATALFRRLRDRLAGAVG